MGNTQSYRWNPDAECFRRSLFPHIHFHLSLFVLTPVFLTLPTTFCSLHTARSHQGRYEEQWGGGEADQCGHSREVSAWWATLHVWKVRFPNLMLPKTIQAHLFALPEEKLWILNCRSCTWILYELQLSWATDRCHCFFWSSTGSQCWSFRQLQLGSEWYVPYQSMFLVFWKWPVWTWWI